MKILYKGCFKRPPNDWNRSDKVQLVFYSLPPDIQVNQPQDLSPIFREKRPQESLTNHIYGYDWLYWVIQLNCWSDISHPGVHITGVWFLYVLFPSGCASSYFIKATFYKSTLRKNYGRTATVPQIYLTYFSLTLCTCFHIFLFVMYKLNEVVRWQPIFFSKAYREKLRSDNFYKCFLSVITANT